MSREHHTIDVVVGSRFGTWEVVRLNMGRGEAALVCSDCQAEWSDASLIALKNNSFSVCGFCDSEWRKKFWSRVDMSGGLDACWTWVGFRDPSGYGQVSLNNATTRAHRVAYRLATGQHPGILDVCHSCDNPPCCNPKHLRADTHEENIADRDRKGHSVHGSCTGRELHPDAYVHLVGQIWHDYHDAGVLRGEKHSMAKITREQALEIRRLYADNSELRQEDLAQMFGLDQTHVSDIVNGVVWAELNVAGELTPREQRKLNKTLRDENIMADLTSGTLTHKAIAAKYGVSRIVLERVIVEHPNSEYHQKLAARIVDLDARDAQVRADYAAAAAAGPVNHATFARAHNITTIVLDRILGRGRAGKATRRVQAEASAVVVEVPDEKKTG